MTHETRQEPTRSVRVDGAEQGAFDVGEAIGSVLRLADESPRVALAVAVGVGFLLGGGLAPRVLVSLLSLAGRRYLHTTVRDALAEVLREQFQPPGSA